MGLSDENNIYIKVELDSSGAVSGIQQVGSEIEKMGDSVEQASGGISEAQANIISLDSALNLLSRGIGLVQSGFQTFNSIISRGDQYNDVAGAFENLNQKAGALSDTILSDLNAATEGAISNLDLMKLSNEAMIKGLKPEVLASVAAKAKEYADATGIDAKQALDKFNNALAMGNEKQLKQLGLLKDGNVLVEKFSQSLSKNNAVQQTSSNFLEKIAASTDNFLDKLSATIEKSPQLAKFLANFANGLEVIFNYLVSLAPLLDKFIGYLNQIGEKLSFINFDNFQRGLSVLKGEMQGDAAQFLLEGVSSLTESVSGANQELEKLPPTLVSIRGAGKGVEDLAFNFNKVNDAVEVLKYNTGEIFGPGNDSGILDFLDNTAKKLKDPFALSEFEQIGIQLGVSLFNGINQAGSLGRQDYVNLGSQAAGSIANSLLPGSGPLVEALSNKIWSSIVGSREAQGKARDDADKAFADIFSASRLSVIVDGQLKQISDLSFGRGSDMFSSGAFDDVLQGLPAAAQQAFTGIGQAFSGILDVGESLGSQLGAIFANNIGGSLNNLQLLVQASSKSFEELDASIENAFLNGELSALQAQAAFAGIQQTAQVGIPDAIGATVTAMNNLTAAGISGGRASIDALQDLASEAFELGFTTLPQLQDQLLASGEFTAESISQLFTQLSSRGIDTLEELQDVSNRTAIDIIAGLGQSDFPFAEASQRVDDLLNKIDEIPDDKEILFKVRTDFDNNTKTAIEKGFIPINAEAVGLANR